MLILALKIVSRKKNATSHFKEHRFFFSQTNQIFHTLTNRVYLLTYWIVFAILYLHFYLLFFDILQIFDILRSSYSAPKLFSKKSVNFSASKCFYYVLLCMKQSYLLTAKITPDVNNSMFITCTCSVKTTQLSTC